MELVCTGDAERRRLNWHPSSRTRRSSQRTLTGGERGTPEQVAQLITFLLSDHASHITGTELWIDGAQSLVMG